MSNSPRTRFASAPRTSSMSSVLLTPKLMRNRRVSSVASVIDVKRGSKCCSCPGLSTSAMMAKSSAQPRGSTATSSPVYEPAACKVMPSWEHAAAMWRRATEKRALKRTSANPSPGLGPPERLSIGAVIQPSANGNTRRSRAADPAQPR